MKQTKKNQKDVPNRKFALKVDLTELCNELDNHPMLKQCVEKKVGG